LAKATYIMGDGPIEVDQFTKSSIEIVHDDQGSLIVFFFGRKEVEGWTHSAAFDGNRAKALLADLNVKIQNLP
jgi:hypothetical protein